jgi:hypothetical protein
MHIFRQRCRLCTVGQMSNQDQVWMGITLTVIIVIFSNTVHTTPAVSDPPLNSDLHSTTTDAVLHTTLTTTGAVGWSKINLDSLDQKISF